MAKTAILLTNLGSPDSPAVADVRRYLNEFLMDGRVMDMPFLKRLLLVRGLIVPSRAKDSAKNYRSIWTDNGSPLIHITKQLTDLVAARTDLPVFMSMRYGSPAPAPVLRTIHDAHPGPDELVMVPLYPHYAMSSYETAVEQVRDIHTRARYPSRLSVVPPYYAHPDYIAALAESIRPYLAEGYDHLLFSYHGIPERHLRKSDPTGRHCLSRGACCETASDAHAICYRHQVRRTTALVADRLQLPAERYSIAFQSRLGRDPWLTPYTDHTLRELPLKGVERLLVVCPAFVSDCLETLEEIDGEGREIFLHAGGSSYTYIPCLNLNAQWVDTIATLVDQVRVKQPAV